MKNRLDHRVRAVKIVDVIGDKGQGVMQEDLEREAKSLSPIAHANIVKYDTCFYDGTAKNPKKRFWLIMELVSVEQRWQSLG